MSGILGDLFPPNGNGGNDNDNDGFGGGRQTGTMAQQGGDQLPKEGPLAPSQQGTTTTQQQQQPRPPAESTSSSSTTTQSPSQQATTSPSAAATTSEAPSSSEPSSTPSSTSSSTTTTSIAPSSSSEPSSTIQSSSSSTTTTTQQKSTTFMTVTKGTAPGLLTASAPSTSASKAADKSGKGGVGGSGLPLGALVGIIIGGLVVIAIIAVLATRTVRKRARARRTAHRGSMFEPWPAPVALEDEPPYEKPAYTDPAQSYPMQDTTTDGYHDAAYPNYGDNGSYPPMGVGYDQYGQQTYGGQYPAEYDAAGVGAAGTAGVGAAGVAGVAAAGVVAGAAVGGEAGGLQDNMMVRVKVGFVRSLEDELAITPGQQLYLHTTYDDGWCLCEDQAQNRGVVPVSCLEPWDENVDQQGLTPSTSDQALTNMSARRSSLYQVTSQPSF